MSCTPPEVSSIRVRTGRRRLLLRMSPGLGVMCRVVRAGVFVGEKLAEVVSRKGPGVDDLLAMGIDDLHDLPSLHERRFSTTGGDFYQRHLAPLNAEP